MVEPTDPRRIPTPEAIEATRALEAKNISAIEFLSTFPLYSPANFAGLWIFPPRLSLDCDLCGKETTWLELSGSDDNRTKGHMNATYACGFCHKEEMRFFVYLDSDKKQIYKVGQHPEPSIYIPKRLATGLRDSAQHYRRGLVCLKQGYGIAAVAYFRRVVEERTNEMIDVVVELGVASGTPEEELKEIRSAKEERNYTKKLETASAMIPINLRPGGVNPLGRLHSLLSEALHSQPEAESVKLAGELQFVIEFVFENLRDYLDSQRKYAARIQAAGNPPPSTEKKL
jgi:hypothetical protein